MSDKFKNYSLHFKNLPEGVHNFYYTLDENFFKHFSESEIEKGEIKVKVIVTVKTNSLLLNFLMKGFVKVQCDLCVDEFDLPIKYKSELLVEFGEENSDITDVDDKIVISVNENEIQLAQHLYEFVHLSLPTKRIHPKDENGNSQCNQEMINKIKEYKVKKEKTNTQDPRWDKLKNLYN